MDRAVRYSDGLSPARMPWRRLTARFTAVCCICVAIAAHGAGCSRTISAAYLSSELDDALDAKPDLNQPPLDRAISDKSGCVIQLTTFPTARVWRQFLAGKLDMVVGGIESDNHNAAGQFVPITSGNWIMLTTRAAGSAPDHLEDFVGHRDLLVGAMRGYGYPSDVAHQIGLLRQHHQLDESTNVGMLVRKLMAGRDAALLLDNITYDLLPNRPESPGVRTLPQPKLAPIVTGVYLSTLSLRDPDRQTLAGAINAVLSDGVVNRLIDAHKAEMEKPH